MYRRIGAVDGHQQAVSPSNLLAAAEISLTTDTHYRLSSMFITLDGGDGCGKSTQQQKLGEWMISQGFETVLCRDPGSTALGDAVRNILLYGTERNIVDRTEVLLFSAARCQMVEEIIKPALRCGKTVISDRFLLSTLVYQGYAGGVPLKELETIGQIATDGVLPDLSFVLDIPYETAIQRMGQRGTLDRMEQKGKAYHQKVRNGFLDYAAKHPDLFRVIDATPPPEEVAAAIRSAVTEREIIVNGSCGFLPS